MEPAKYFSVEQIKSIRMSIDGISKTIGMMQNSGTETYCDDDGLYSLALMHVETRLIEAKMWMGKMMEALGSKLPEEYRDDAPAK